MKTLFSVDRETFTRLAQAADRGDQNALQSLRDLWGYDRGEIRCFLCSNIVSERPILGGLIFPSLHDEQTLCGAVICAVCSSLPADERWAQTLARLEEEDGKSLTTVH